MDFRLTTLSDAFHDAEYQASRQEFSLFAFVLATNADEAIFPGLLVHLLELHELTSHYILVIAPKILMNKWADIPMDASEIAHVLKSGVFSNYQTRGNRDVSGPVEEFLEKQTSETIKLARFCGIGVDPLPCILFFTSLENPKSYAYWSLKEQNASSVVKDFRTIVARIEDYCGQLIDLTAEIRKLREQRESLKQAQEWRRNNERLENKLKLLGMAERLHHEYTSTKSEYQASPDLRLDIEAAGNDLLNDLSDLNSQQRIPFPMGRISKKIQGLLLNPYDDDLEAFIHKYVHGFPDINEKFEKYLALVRSQKERKIETRHRTDLAADIEAAKGELYGPLQEIDARLASLISRKEEFSSTCLDVISSLDSKRLASKTLESGGSFFLIDTRPPQTGVNTEVVRALLIAAFDDTDLMTFCFDRFYPVYNERFGTGMSKSQKVQSLLDYCVRQGLIEALLELVKERNSYQYNVYADFIFAT